MTETQAIVVIIVFAFLQLSILLNTFLVAEWWRMRHERNEYRSIVKQRQAKEHADA